MILLLLKNRVLSKRWIVVKSIHSQIFLLLFLFQIKNSPNLLGCLLIQKKQKRLPSIQMSEKNTCGYLG